MNPQQAKVTVYRTATCPFCIGAVELLRSRGVDFDEVPLDDHPDRGAVTSSILPGHYTVPLIIIGDRPVGGFNELRALDAAGELDQLLAAG